MILPIIGDPLIIGISTEKVRAVPIPSFKNSKPPAPQDRFVMFDMMVLFHVLRW